MLHQRGRAGATGKGDHQHRGPECLGGVSLGFRKDLHEEEAIADGASRPAITALLGSEGLDPSAKLMVGTHLRRPDRRHGHRHGAADEQPGHRCA